MAAWALLALLALAPAAAGGMLSFASYYGDHMVLQQKPSGAVVWGHGELGAMVTLTLSGASGLVIMEKTAQVKGPSGTWTTVLDPMDRGGPYALTAEQGLENVTLRDIYFGDVWLCSGQSNMAMTVLQVANASQELAAAARYPYVRIFAAAPARSSVELEDLERIDLPWSIPTAAVCWLLGRSLYETLGSPIGLVEVAWGGTPIEAWSSRRVLQACGLPEDTGSTSPHQHLSGPQTPSVLWNAMIHPLLNMTLRGVAWYQGEANTFLNTDKYNCTFPALIADWRRAFHAGSAGQTEPLLPFGFVQLSTYRRGSADDSFARLRWHQTADLGVVPNARMPSTFMAVAMDLGDEHSPYGSVHPRDKQNVAHRLLLGAMAVAYGDKGLVFQGPYPTRAVLEVTRGLLNVTYSQELICRQRDAQAFEVRSAISSQRAAKGKGSTDGGFSPPQVCCSSQASPCQWQLAPVVAVGSRTVTLALSGCRTLVLGLRYAWAEWPCDYQACPLYNSQGLPVPPFLLDTLPAGNTDGGRELLLLPGSSSPLN
ncbi:sialate O-acetylesterase isoform X2 [Motacilla alba alba]|uniref:sialate O-acetylesterase isoform X2 n=1 Tax=Motacilla alba alba TaxID=1094192 RepID=UPI0018D584B3|nr:sialate O-acetylesterase isoform X2 [Motacilla alba alba]